MKLRTGILGLVAALFLFLTPAAQAGVIRKAGASVVKGTGVVARSATSGGEAVADGATSAASATRGVVKSGASTAWDGAKAAPRMVVHGTARASKAIWHVIW